MSDAKPVDEGAEGAVPAAEPPKEELPPAEESIESLRAQLAEEREKAQAYLANWQRAAADYQNFKRRVEEERSEATRFANAALIINLLPVVDDLERALRSLDVNLRGLTWVEGIYLIHRKLLMVLENAGVTEIPAEGLDFDPTVHEAISQAEGEEGKVVAVVQKGYKLGDRVIRPALVIVGKGKPQPQPPQTEGSGQAPEGGDANPAS
ncbi:MAG TPA: nucleotide exchange factor GrpE [Dehalococcoidia bacterium]|nr:nucleotide exchange factor GrpE [Dehalococcoidia bacterium]